MFDGNPPPDFMGGRASQSRVAPEEPGTPGKPGHRRNHVDVRAGCLHEMLQPIFDEHPMIGLDGVWIKRGERQDAKPIAGTLIHDSESYRQGIVLLSMSAALPGRLLGATIVNAEALATLSQ